MYVKLGVLYNEGVRWACIGGWAGETAVRAGEGSTAAYLARRQHVVDRSAKWEIARHHLVRNDAARPDINGLVIIRGQLLRRLKYKSSLPGSVVAVQPHYSCSLCIAQPPKRCTRHAVLSSLGISVT